MSKVLFLCTSNHYRSRFAAMLFNDLALRRQMEWTAESRGIAVAPGTHMAVPISPETVKGLQTRGITLLEKPRQPLPVEAGDFAQADQIIALNESEHRPMLRMLYPEWENKVEYWHIRDLHLSEAESALSVLEEKIRGLIAQLARTGPAKP
jgi:protein-tyrosine phosphatase